MRNATRNLRVAAALLVCLVAGVAAARAQQQGGGAARAKAQPTPTPQASAPSTAKSTPVPLDMRVKASESTIDASIPDDPAVEAIIAPYTAKVRELNAPIGKLAGQLKKGGIGGGSLGNFVADALRARAEARLGRPVLLAITNSGGLRKNEIAEGNLSSNDIYELLPFENALVALDLTGEQLRSFLNVVITHRDAQSGARIAYRTNEKKVNEIVTVKLGGAGAAVEQEIDPKATYTIVTIDYLVKRGGDYSVLQEAKNVRPLNLTMRDAVLEYIKTETAAGRVIKATLDGRFHYDKPGAGPNTEDEPQ